MTEELKNCPFCGLNDALLICYIGDEKALNIACRRCFVSMGSKFCNFSHDELIKHWNTRVESKDENNS